MMHLLSRIAMLTVLVLSGCRTTTDPVTLRNPQTGNTVECGPYDEKSLTAEMAASKRDACIQDYKRQGYERVKEFGASPAVVR